MRSFCSVKASLIFSTKNISVFDCKVVKHLTSWPLNELAKLTMLWTTGPRMIVIPNFYTTFFRFIQHTKLLYAYILTVVYARPVCQAETREEGPWWVGTMAKLWQMYSYLWWWYKEGIQRMWQTRVSWLISVSSHFFGVQLVAGAHFFAGGENLYNSKHPSIAHSHLLSLYHHPVTTNNFNRIALRKAKILCNSGLSECNRVRKGCKNPSLNL